MNTHIKNLFPSLFFALASLMLFASCGNEAEKQQTGEDTLTQPNIPQTQNYLLENNFNKFIGNETVPDFPFDEAFVSSAKIFQIIVTERFVPAKSTNDTAFFLPLYVWVFDSAGQMLQKHIFENTKIPVHSDHYIEKKNIKNIGMYNVNINSDAVTVLVKDGKRIIEETRTEATTADTTRSFFKNEQLDSVSVSFLNGKQFYIKFERYPNGAIKRRILKEADKNELSKDWIYHYNGRGYVERIEERNLGNGNYTFEWDEKGRLISSAYSLEGKSVYEKKLKYDEKGRISSLEMQLQEGRSFYDFVYKTK